MGFKKIDLDDLKTKLGENFLGIPIREGGKLVQKSQRDSKIESSYMGSASEVLILDEEFLEFQYQNNGIRKSVLGNGNISIFNNSVKDRIWDANLQFSGSQFNNQNEENNVDLGIFEPNSNKVLKYEIVNSEQLPDLIKVYESIENLSEEVKLYQNLEQDFILIEDDVITHNLEKNLILLLGKENKVKFSISVENTSNYRLENVNIKKHFINKFYNFEFESNKTKEYKIKKNLIEWSLHNLEPGEKTEFIIRAKVFPKKKEEIRTGNLDLKFNLRNQVISGIEINHFSAYSHAMHAIRKKEKDHAPNHWQCSMIFENHSDFNMKLKSILILSNSHSETLLDLDFNSNGGKVLLPRGKYETEYFDFIDEKEPAFSRKVEYSVDYKMEYNSMITVSVDDSHFKLAGVLIKKKLSEAEIKSFEEASLDSKIIVENKGTFPIKGLKVIEKIPEDFLPPSDISEYQLCWSSGEFSIEDIKLKISPDDDDPSHEHIIELDINLNNNDVNSAIRVNDFLEVKYPLKAITPDYKKAYEFPLDVHTYYPKFINLEEETYEDYFVVMDKLSDMEKSSIKISHNRRKLMIGKEIFPGRNINEFAIYIIAKNGSNIKLTDVNITDTFPNSFELISSNIEHKLSKSKKNGVQKISFTIDTILPYQEKEIMYYLKNVSGKDVKTSELESFFVG